ncbi:flagellar synthesis anti-sigma-D factor [Bacillus sp. FJAT-18019]|nr:flagellar synthesis anti-sigma-D factor [Bacillus sp. FJAT-18019]
MKINETGRVGGINSYKRNMDIPRQEGQKTNRKKDEISISAEAMEMLQAKDKTIDAERAQKIQDLKSRVSAGTYHVDAEKLADKLIPYFKQFPES